MKRLYANLGDTVDVEWSFFDLEITDDTFRDTYLRVDVGDRLSLNNTTGGIRVDPICGLAKATIETSSLRYSAYDIRISVSYADGVTKRTTTHKLVVNKVT